jgi:serine/threonine-protein kinase RsbW
MDPESRPLTLTLPSDLRHLPIILSFIEGVCRAGELDHLATSAVVLATCEAASNVLRHAHRDHPDATLQLQCRIKPGAIEIRLLDEGEPFDLDAVPNLDPSEIRIGGRGVFLMRRLMDELDCYPRPQRGNALRMVKRFSPNAAPAPLTARIQ